ncbi:MAG TPA: hypothetical protein VMU46_12475 [Burkholderiales bacterium]|nr:hypothetical protein [Burkholderiales bacterium]
MKSTKILFATLLVLAGALAAQPASAGPYYRGGYYGGGHWHGSVGLYFGFPAFGYGYPYYAPYYYPPYGAAYYPSPVVVQQQAPVYVEQSPQPAPAAQPSAPAGYWYYCTESRGYYPYVKECPAGWQRVAPQPGG